MSIRCIDRVWKHSQAKGSALLLLLAIADYANDAGTGAYPGVETLAAKTKLTGRSVQRLIHRLVETGELWVDYKASAFGTNQYAILVAVTPMSPGGDADVTGVVTSTAQGGDAHVTRVVTPVSPDPLVNPSVNPSVETEERPSRSDGHKNKYTAGKWAKFVNH